MTNSTLANDLGSKGSSYTVTGGPTGAIVTEAEIMDALNINNAGNTTSPITGRNTWALTEATVDNADGGPTFGTIPGVDGNNIPNIAANTAARFLPTAGTYAYVYDATTGSPTPTEVYTAVQLTSANEPGDFTSYYKQNSDGTFTQCLTGDYTQNNYYYQKYTNQNKVYGVKVIKVALAP